MSSRPVRLVLTLVMNVLLFGALVLAFRLVVEFFGSIAGQAWAKGFVGATRALILPLKVTAISTPYGGRFDIDVAVTVCVIIAIEWALSAARRTA